MNICNMAYLCLYLDHSFVVLFCQALSSWKYHFILAYYLLFPGTWNSFLCLTEANFEEIKHCQWEACEGNVFFSTWGLMQRKGGFKELYKFDKFEASVNVKVLLNLRVGRKGWQESGKLDFCSHEWKGVQINIYLYLMRHVSHGIVGSMARVK